MTRHYVIMATFGPDGPAQCSGLPVMRYAPQELHAQFGQVFTLLSYEEQLHRAAWPAPAASMRRLALPLVRHGLQPGFAHRPC